MQCLERELAKLRDLNEIILGDFRKVPAFLQHYVQVEKERDALLESLETNLQRVQGLTRRRKEATDSRLDALLHNP